MPKIVDHAARRGEIVDAFLRIARRNGIDAATSRAIAVEVNSASGALWHYFDNFDSVLVAASEVALGGVNERLRANVASQRGLAALVAVAEEGMTLSQETQDDAFITVGLWQRAVFNNAILPLHRELSAQWSDILVAHVTEAVDDGELIKDTPVQDLVDCLCALGISAQVAHSLGLHLAEPARQRAMIRTCIAPWLVDTDLLDSYF